MRAMISATPTPEALMVRRSQVNVYEAIDRYLGECARRGLAEATRRKYRQILDPFGDTIRHKATDEITLDDCRRYLDRWVDASESTLALHVSILRGFGQFCEDERIVARSFASHLRRPRRKRPEDLDVVTISTEDVLRMLRACADWQELLCIAVVFYMGIRRQAACDARRRDVDLDAGVIRFREKGGKIIRKTIPDELLALLRRADDLGQWLGPDEWLIPNRKPWLVKSTRRRGSKMIYETVVRVADRAGVRSHVHALRGAFAVQFDAQHPDRIVDLKDFLGHSRLETTMTYIRRRAKSRAMETARDVSVFPANAVVPPAGFEPAFPPSADLEPSRRETEPYSLADALLLRAHEQTEAGKPAGRVSRATVPEDAQTREGAGDP